MIYNKKYNRWFSKSGHIFRLQNKTNKLILCKQSVNANGYLQITINKKSYKAHRIIYETFCGSIPENYVIDHINTIRNDNRLENLRCVTVEENNRNPLTLEHLHKKKSKRTTNKNKNNKNKKPNSIFGIKFKEHYGITKKDDPSLYGTEISWYRRHHKFRWVT